MTKKENNVHQLVENTCALVQIAKDTSDKALKLAQEAMDKVTLSTERNMLTAQTLDYIKADIKEIKEKLDNKYVSKEEFSTVKNIAYGLVSLTCIAVFGALIALVVT